MNSAHRPLPFVLAATNHGTFIVNRNDLGIEDENVRFGVGYELLSTGSYSPTQIELELALLGWRQELQGDGVVAVDCGANIGVHTIEWAKQMTNWGRVIAIEAQEMVFYMLAGNICLNNCLNARAVHGAVSNVEGHIRVPKVDYNATASFGSVSLLPEKSYDVGQPLKYEGTDATSVTAFAIDGLDLERCDLIKIDVEGMEAAVLDGAEETIKRCQPYMVVEHIKSDREELEQKFKQHEYLFWIVGPNYLTVPADDPAADRIRRSNQ
jgi:FkbM family methyltransferase